MNLKKLALAACIAPWLAAPALAQQGAEDKSVQIYGKLYPYLLSEQGSGASPSGTAASSLSANPTGANTLDSTTGISSGNSRIGLRGSKALSGGLKASFQLEGVIQVDNGDNGGKNFNFNRDNYVGLEGGFGALKYGNLETIFKTYGDTLSFLGVSSGTFMSTSNILRRPGFGSSSTSRFHERFANSIQYETPTLWKGVVFGLQYSSEENANNATANKRAVSAGVRYEAGPIYLSLAHEIHYDYFGASNNISSSSVKNTVGGYVDTRDSATQISLVYKLNSENKIGFDLIHKFYNEAGDAVGKFETYQNVAYQVAYENKINDKVRAAFNVARSDAGTCTRIGGTVCSTEGLEGMKYTAGFSYALDRDVQLFAAVSLLQQGRSASYQVTEFSNKANVGENIQHMAVGISYSF